MKKEKEMNTKFWLFFILLVNVNLLSGQKQIWDIFTVEDQPYSSVVLSAIENDTLIVKGTGNEYKIAINSIKILKRERKSKTGISALAGIVSGGVLMYFLGKKKAEEQSKFPIDLSDLSVGFSTGLGMIGGGLTGYIVGTGLSADEVYDFSKRSSEKRRKILEHIIARNN